MMCEHVFEPIWCKICGGYAGDFCIYCDEIYPYASGEHDEYPPDEDCCPYGPGLTCEDANNDAQ